MVQEDDRPAAPSDPATLIAEIERARAASAPVAPPRERIWYLGFLLEGELYGVRLDQLREVAPLGRLRRLPGAPRGVAGLVNLRGEILCALDTRALLDLPSAASGAPAYLVVLRGFDEPLALVVDAVADIYSLDPEQIEPPPATWPAERAARFAGMARVADGIMGLLDLAHLVEG
jgi:purine-binding chemotaxis protein CheW